MRLTTLLRPFLKPGGLLLLGTLIACHTPQAEAGASSPDAPPTPPGQSDVRVALEAVTTELEQPTSVTHAGDGSDRLFVTQKTGLIQVIEAGAVRETPFLDLSNRVSTSSEQGLLGLAFSPDYANDGRLFVNYTDLEGSTVVAEFTVSDDPNLADPASERVLLTVAQPYANHNGGGLAFGPDGYLYIGLGDGGAGGDPEGNGQDPSTLLGSLLRIDVGSGGEAGQPYTVPDTNPFVGRPDAAPEVWAYGLRNPWGFSFDRETGDLWIADVGQNAFEEINRQPAGSPGGENYGWNRMEGFHCFDPASPREPPERCDQTGLTLPVLAYSHASGDGRSVTGGYVYRGAALPELHGSYVFGDFVSGNIWRAVPEGESYTHTLLLEAGFPVVAFGEDEAGELYVADFGGALYRFVAAE
jgi:glucose/arabinose dehydrogenase